MKKLKQFYIYIIQNKINNKIYVGWTSNIKLRKHQHFSKKYINKNKKRHLYAALNKYGKKNFSFVQIEIFDNKEDVFNAEIFWIEFFRSWDRNVGYNLSRGGESGNFGTKLTNEQKEKISKRVRGSSNINSILNEELVTKLRKEYSESEDPYFISNQAKLLNLTESCLYSCINGNSWKHVDYKPKKKKIKRTENGKKNISISMLGHNNSVGSKNSMAKLKEEDIIFIRKSYESNPTIKTQHKLSEQFNTPQQNIYQIITRRRWKHVI